MKHAVFSLGLVLRTASLALAAFVVSNPVANRKGMHDLVGKGLYILPPDHRWVSRCEAERVKRFILLAKAAQLESPESEYELGLCFWNGEGVEPNMGRAVEWIEKAARQGFPKAMFCMGVARHFGLDGVTNCIAACQFFRAAAEKGVGDPDLELGDLEREGCGPEVSARWIIHIARTGDGNAMLWAARCYRDGVGVRRDKRLARAWYKRALEAGNDFAVDDFGYYQPHYLTR